MQLYEVSMSQSALRVTTASNNANAGCRFFFAKLMRRLESGAKRARESAKRE